MVQWFLKWLPPCVGSPNTQHIVGDTAVYSVFFRLQYWSVLVHISPIDQFHISLPPPSSPDSSQPPGSSGGTGEGEVEVAGGLAGGAPC